MDGITALTQAFLHLTNEHTHLTDEHERLKAELAAANQLIAEMSANMEEFVAAADRTGVKHDALRNRTERARALIARAKGAI